MGVRRQAPQDQLPQSRDRRHQHQGQDPALSSPRPDPSRARWWRSSAPAGSARWAAPRSALDAVADMKEKWQAAGRDLKDLHVHGEIGGCVLRDGEAYDLPARQGRGRADRDHAGARFGRGGDAGPRRPASAAGAWPPRSSNTARSIERMEPADARYLANHRRPSDVPEARGARHRRCRADQEFVLDRDQARIARAAARAERRRLSSASRCRSATRTRR